MREYMREHERKIRLALSGRLDKKAAAALAGEHAVMISRMQHERLIHLLVTLFFGLVIFMLLSAALLLQNAALPRLQKGGLWALLVLMIPLESAYIVHYFYLENGVQRWYKLADELSRRGARRPGGKD